MSAQSQQSATIVRAEAARMGLNAHMTDALLRIMMVESGGNPSASAGTSSAKGLFQILDGEWNDLCRRFPDIAAGGQANVLDPAQNARAAIHMLVEKEQQMRHNIGREPTAGEFYLSHFAGLTGATRIINAAPNTPMTQLMSPKAIQANRNIRFQRPDGTTVYLPNMTAADMRAWAEQKMGGSGVPVSTPGMPGASPDLDDTTVNDPNSPNYTPGRPSGILEMILQFIFGLLTNMFDTSAPRQPDNSGQPPQPGPPPAPPAPPRDPSTYLQPEVAYDLAVLNNLGLPDEQRSRAQMLRLFDADGNQRISEAEILRFDINHNGVLDVTDIGAMRRQLLGVDRPVSPDASATDVISAYGELLRNPPHVTLPAIDTALGLDLRSANTLSLLTTQGVKVDLSGPGGAPDGTFDQNDLNVMSQRLRDAGVVVQNDPNAVVTTYAQQFGRQQAPSTPVRQ